jgi:protein phosphatase
MEITFASFTNLGPRASNQDRLLEPELKEGYCIAAIADGMGGSEGGATAAEVAIDLTRNLTADPERMGDVFPLVVRHLRDISEKDAALAKMGTTLSVLMIKDDIVYTAHVGDTRIYHVRGAGLKTLTEDQTEVAELRRKGVLSESQARRHPRRNVLSSALTSSGNYKVHYSRARVEIGDRLLLVSDGVYQTILKGAVISASVRHASIEALLDEIDRGVAANEPTDNYSAIGIQIEELLNRG